MTGSSNPTLDPLREEGWRRWLLSENLILVLTALLFLVMAPFTPGLTSVANLVGILAYLLPLLIVAVGMTLVMITGGIDLSVTSIIALTSVVGAYVVTGDGGPLAGHALATPAGVAAMLILGALLGAANGATITVLRLPPFIVTMASMIFLSGFAVWLTQSRSIYNLPASFLAFGKNNTAALAITIVVATAVHLLLRGTVYGRWLYATGQNATAALISGVPVRTMTFSAYVISGLCAATASIILTGRLETGSPVLGREILLDIIAATVIGGTSLFGGKGRVVGTFYGVLFLTVLGNVLDLLNLSHFTITMVKGAVILLAAILDAVRQRFSRLAA